MVESNYIDPSFWYHHGALVCGVVAIMWCLGLAVRHLGIKVNYTRKISHFCTVGASVGASYFLPYLQTTGANTVRVVLVFAVFLLFIAPIRSRVGFIGTAFMAIDRPEDRPFTLRWLALQHVAMVAVLYGLKWLFVEHDVHTGLLSVPVAIIFLGDGLAEPVGVRFGRHPYKVGALFTSKTYIRTLEGSAVVFAVGVAAVLLTRGVYSGAQFATAMAIVPLAGAVAEARSPHTLDAPFVAAVCGLALFAIMKLVS